MHRLPEGQAYAGRSADVIPMQCSIEREALELARVRLVGPKKLGAYVSRLIYEDCARHQARQEERTRLQQAGEAT